MGGNHSVWERRTSIERYVANYGLAVIMPSTDLGWYTDTVYDMKYWTFIAEELPEICHELFPQLTRKREKTYAAGLSMGGYGALKLGLAKSENFAAVISLSGAVSVGNRMDDLLMVRKPVPRFYMACGESDFLYQANQEMVSAMQEQGLAVTFEQGPGDHNWIFWDQWIQRALAWLMEEK